MKSALSFVAIVFSVTLAFAKAGQPVPAPVQSVAVAIQMVEFEFRKTYPDNKQFTEAPGFQIKDFFVKSAVYTNTFKDKPLTEWSWVITFVHPVHNDNSFIFQLRPNGNILLLGQTE